MANLSDARELNTPCATMTLTIRSESTYKIATRVQVL